MIIDITRGHIVFGYRGKTVTIQGEAYLPGYDSPDFVVYSNTIRHWDPPDEVIQIDEETKKELLLTLEKEMRDRGMTIEIE